jgi:hypothetical protein
MPYFDTSIGREKMSLLASQISVPPSGMSGSDANCVPKIVLF